MNFTDRIENEVRRAYNTLMAEAEGFSAYHYSVQLDWVERLVVYAFNNRASVKPELFDYMAYVGKFGLSFCDASHPSGDLVDYICHYFYKVKRENNL